MINLNHKFLKVIIYVNIVKICSSKLTCYYFITIGWVPFVFKDPLFVIFFFSGMLTGYYNLDYR